MSESVIDVKLTETGKWGLYIGDYLVGSSKSNCDTMLRARQMAKLFDPEPQVINHYHRNVA